MPWLSDPVIRSVPVTGLSHLDSAGSTIKPPYRPWLVVSGEGLAVPKLVPLP